MSDPLLLRTERLILEPVTENHVLDLWNLLKDEELHSYVPFEPVSLEHQRERFLRWSKRTSPSGDEIWLNWVARISPHSEVIGHFQAGVKKDSSAYVGYVVARSEQRKGYASEALRAVIALLHERFEVHPIEARIHVDNEASVKLVKKLGFSETARIKDAEEFKGQRSDECVFTLK